MRIEALRHSTSAQCARFPVDVRGTDSGTPARADSVNLARFSLPIGKRPSSIPDPRFARNTAKWKNHSTKDQRAFRNVVTKRRHAR